MTGAMAGTAISLAILVTNPHAFALLSRSATPTFDLATPNSEVSKFSDKDVLLIYHAMFAPEMARNLLEIMKDASDMPPADPLCHYVGRTTGGKYAIWINKEADRSEMDWTKDNAMLRARTAAYALAAMDSGAAGGIWQTEFNNASDPSQLGQAYAIAFKRLSDKQAEKSHEDIAWIHASIRPGMSRARTYTLLRGRGLIATNGLYNPGRQIGQRGCSFEDQTPAEWPRMNEPLPTPGCTNMPFEARKFIRNPDANITFGTEFTIACGSEVTLTLSFDMKDQITSIKDSKESTTCL